MPAEASSPPDGGTATAFEDRSQLADIGELTLAYEEFGDPADEPLLLVMGLGMQMLGWDERFCELLAGRGFHVIRFDNRDVGRSTKLSGNRVNVVAGMVGLTGSAAYTLTEMATDTVGLLDHLELERVHLVGASMGGMIAQKVAASRPDRVRSLCSIMAGTGKRKLSTLPRLGAFRLLTQSPAESREEFIEGLIRTFSAIGSPAYPPDPDRLRERAARSYDRCFYPPGATRQLMAVLASGDRTGELRRIEAPTVVIHGEDDPLVPVRAGRDTAREIPGARLELIPGMGHDLPPELWDHFADLIEANARPELG